MANFAKGKYAKAISDRSGMEFPYNEMVKEWNGSFVHRSEFESKHPQIRRRKITADKIAIQNARPRFFQQPSIMSAINPQAPTHLLIIPKKVIPKLSDANQEDQAILGHLMLVAGKISRQLELDDTFRLIVNNGAKAGQSVFHLHLHLMSGRVLNWPPG